MAGIGVVPDRFDMADRIPISAQQTLGVFKFATSREKQAYPAGIKCDRENDPGPFLIGRKTHSKSVVIVINQKICIGVPTAKERDCLRALLGNWS